MPKNQSKISPPHVAEKLRIRENDLNGGYFMLTNDEKLFDGMAPEHSKNVIYYQVWRYFKN